MVLFKPHASKEELEECKAILIEQLTTIEQFNTSDRKSKYRRKILLWFDAVQTKLIELRATEVKPEQSAG
jgi:hypothetical protein